MKIVISAASAKMGGALQYVGSVLRRLPSVAADSQLLVFLPPETARKMKSVAPQSVRLLPVSISHAAWWKRLWWDQVTLRRFLRKERVDVLFATGNFGMWRCPVRQILLVNNALYFSALYQRLFVGKQSLPRRIALRLRRRLAIRSVRNADVIMTPSRAMLQDLRRFVDVAPEQALVNPYGADPTGRASAPPSRTQDRASVRLLYVSLYAEHKNLVTLLKAIPLLNASGGPSFTLTTLANPAWEGARWTRTCQADLKLARQRGIREFVQLVGPLDHAETLALYHQADILVFPSLIESFGFPMVEGMAHGLPIVAADTRINHEICEDAALYFDSLDEADLARRVLQLHRDRELWAKLACAGQRRATQRFRWEDHVQRLVRAARAGTPADGPEEIRCKFLSPSLS